MFSPALGRVVRSTSSISTPPVCTLGRPVAVLGAAQQSLARRPQQHQRRPSSSKASIPPDGANKNESSSAQQAPEAKANAGSSGKTPARKVTGRAGKKRAVPQPALNLPHVPPTAHLHKPEVKISSFFSLHRPISVASTIPPIATNASFDSIFKARSPNDRKSIMDNIQTLSGGIESLEVALRVHEEKQTPEDAARFEADSVDELVARLVPFTPPPAPVPFDQATEYNTVPTRETAITPLTATPVTQRSWSTMVVVTESTDAVGKRTYSATTAPMVEDPTLKGEASQEIDEYESRHPFLERMRQRRITNSRNRSQRPGMLAISVKRQRKLKMKKHKYKKLMKRTRLERRKLDRL
ncbi:hypothetical protein BDV95DRAFT_173043 [Massariosphaeria phaeospora]|uniref:Small ribosomal subunit protein mS38 n=1 Tax=Massariosphaeria phaeospora TaxID=100035 RepID=A0A7C8I8A4_9PLEO|nr:hypothetical protein BDV95DRAFT_173043 [Massariosphaeria phaeospora]